MPFEGTREYIFNHSNQEILDRKNKIIIIFGPTASGKTEYSVNLAKEIKNAEIINADSMQIYKEIPIITNQPTELEKKGIPHHLFGIKSILDKSDLNKWLELAVEKIKEIRERGNIPILIGGTGMYLKALVKGISPIPEISLRTKELCQEELGNLGLKKLHKKLVEKKILDPKKIKSGDKQRLMRAYEVYQETEKTIEEWNKKENRKFFEDKDFEVRFIDKSRNEVYTRINKRFENMVENGVLEEAEKAAEIFDNSGCSEEKLLKLPAYKAHGLREIIEYIKGKRSKENAIEKAQQATRNYAKRQFTWWRGWDI